MDQLSFLLVVLAERLFRRKHDARLQMLEAQIRFLRVRIDTSRLVRSPDEKHELPRLGALLPPRWMSLRQRNTLSLNVVSPRRADE